MATEFRMPNSYNAKILMMMERENRIIDFYSNFEKWLEEIAQLEKTLFEQCEHEDKHQWQLKEGVKRCRFCPNCQVVQVGDLCADGIVRNWRSRTEWCSLRELDRFLNSFCFCSVFGIEKEIVKRDLNPYADPNCPKCKGRGWYLAADWSDHGVQIVCSCKTNPRNG
jgi:hypothetical protein